MSTNQRTVMLCGWEANCRLGGKLMAAHHWVDDLSHLQADCLYTGIRSGPNAW